MLSGISSSLSGLHAEAWAAAAAAHDIANAQTPGYRPVEVERETAPSGGVAVRHGGVAAVQGPIVPTGNPLDLAIAGDGFFQIRGADGQVALTRTGTFRTDADGEIVTAGGAKLVPPVSVPPLVGPLTVNPDGTISSAGRTFGRIELVEVPAPEGLRSLGDGRYRTTVASGGAVPSTGSRIEQGALEQASTDLVASIAELATGRHSFAANVRALETQDELARALLAV